jgi:hypothetical protein
MPHDKSATTATAGSPDSTQVLQENVKRTESIDDLATTLLPKKQMLHQWLLEHPFDSFCPAGKVHATTALPLKETEVTPAAPGPSYGTTSVSTNAKDDPPLDNDAEMKDTDDSREAEEANRNASGPVNVTAPTSDKAGQPSPTDTDVQMNDIDAEEDDKKAT